MTFANRAEWELDLVKRAVYFTTILFKGRGQYDRAEFPTLRAAIVDATAKGGRHMVYAVTEEGRSTMLPPADWERFLQLRGE